MLRYETLHFKVHNQPLELHEASEIMKEYQLLRDHWIKLQQLKQTWEEFLDSCEAAWESCLATEKELCLLEDVHAKWEPPTVNHNTVVQLEEMEVRMPLIICSCLHDYSVCVSQLLDISDLSFGPLQI